MNNHLLQLKLLGSPQIEQNNQQLDGFKSRKAKALLFYLATTKGMVMRDTLISFLWEDLPEFNARHNLRNVLTNLRKLVGPNLTITPSTVEFNRRSNYWLDVEAFLQGLRTRAQLAEATTLYRGEFLQGFNVRDAPQFEAWVSVQREHLHALASKALDQLADTAFDTGNVEAGLDATRRLLYLEPWHESGLRKKMRLLVASGQRDVAIAEYEAFRKSLDRELGLTPVAATTELFEQIQDGALIAVGPASPIVEAQPTRPPPTPHNLPHQPTNFVDRKDELRLLAQYFTVPTMRLITICGPGGIGKTRLALATATARLADFADGVYFVPLAPLRTAAEIIPSMAVAIDCTLREGYDLKRQLLAHLQAQRLLLVVDNVENLIDANGQLDAARTLIAECLDAAPQVKILVTSREPLGMADEQVMHIAGLPWPTGDLMLGLRTYAAVELFRQRLRGVRQSLSDAEIVEAYRICKLTEGMPLALELAAPLTRRMTLAEVAQSVADNLGVLTAADQNGDPRHQSIRAVLDASWPRLTDAEKLVCARISLLRGGFTWSDAHHVALATREQLARLVDTSWVRMADGRYAMHALIQQYASAQLAADPHAMAEAQKRHSTYYGDCLAQQIADWQADYEPLSLDAIAQDAENILAGWQWLLDHGEPELLGPYLEPLWRFYRVQGRTLEAANLLQQALTRATAVAPVTRANWLALLGETAYALGQQAKSDEHTLAALDWLGWPMPQTRSGLLLRTLRQIGTQVWGKVVRPSRVDVARAHARTIAVRAYSRLINNAYLDNAVGRMFYCVFCGANSAERAGEDDELAIAYANMAVLMGYLSPRWAAHYMAQATAAAQRSGNPAARADVAMRQGVVLISQGQWDRAQTHLEHALELYEQVRDWRRRGEVQTVMCTAASIQGHASRCAQHSQETMALATLTQDGEQQDWSGVMRALDLHYRGHSGAAADLLADVLPRLARTNENAAVITTSYGVLAQAQAQRGRLADAQQAAQTALDLIGDRPPTAVMMLGLYANVIRVHLAAWEAAAPDERAQFRALAWAACRKLDRYARMHKIGVPYLHLYRGGCFWLEGKPDRARQAWHKAKAAAKAVSLTYVVGIAHYEIGRHLDVDHPARIHHLQHAVDILEQYDAAYYLAKAQDALANA